MPANEIGLRHRLKRLAQQIADQHRQLDGLRKEVSAALEREARADSRHALKRFRALLSAHFDLEQSVIFPALHGLAPGKTQELEAIEREHAGFLAALHRIQAAIETAPAESFARAFEHCLSDLRSHEQREERLVGEISERG
jgi:chromosome segregation ATPase